MATKGEASNVVTKVELNNVAIKDLPQVLKKETLMEGHWSLIENAEAYCQRLHDAGIRHSTDVFDAVADPDRVGTIARETLVPEGYLRCLNSLLSHHRFKPIPLRKIEDVERTHVDALISRGIKNTGALLQASRTEAERIRLASETGIPLETLNGLLTAADLMRKPGVKATKVRLFTAVGIRSLKHLGEQDPQSFRAQLEDFIGRTGIVKAIPTPKEVASDVSWARLYPVIIE